MKAKLTEDLKNQPGDNRLKVVIDNNKKMEDKI